jgi:NTP pyrophosphatase (non-canonical NTP hydrolase)
VTTYTSLREANIARQKEWVGKAPPVDLSFRSNEMMGEVGEVMELFVERPREPDWKDRMADEMADVVITADLLLLDASAETALPVDGDCDSGGPLTFGASAGKVANVVKKLERERQGFVGSTADVVDLVGGLRRMLGLLKRLASFTEINVDQAVARKFNATSRKLGFGTELALVPGQSLYALHGLELVIASSWADHIDLKPGETFTPIRLVDEAGSVLSVARSITFDTLEELAKQLHDEGDTALEGELRASFARGTGGIDIDRVVDILITLHNSAFDDVLKALDKQTALNERLILRLTTLEDELGRLHTYALEPLD